MCKFYKLFQTISHYFLIFVMNSSLAVEVIMALWAENGLVNRPSTGILVFRLKIRDQRKAFF